MTPRNKSLLRYSALLTMVLIVLVWIITYFTSSTAMGEEGLTIWFYDLSEKRLYEVPRETLAPDTGIGGISGDGVRAWVVDCRSDQCGADTRKIAYLEQYSPELKKILEDIHAAHRRQRPYAGTIPLRDGDFFQKNTLVRQLDNDQWFEMTSASGQQIIKAWRNWSCPQAGDLIVCTP
ncbi:MAG: hypothetical protein HJJLKODD_01153 [Phycisphaerae bacterium]|nr:hypothetical protein [Phycisphaerae bacterium]